MKSLVFLLILSFSLSIFSDEEVFERFQKFIKRYRKHYHSIEEYMSRYTAFKNNLNLFESKALQKKLSNPKLYKKSLQLTTKSP